MFPKDYDASKKYPLIISVHGGPSWACLSSWSTDALEDMRAASLLGWFVLCPNVRGSFGQGEALGCIADQFLPPPNHPNEHRADVLRYSAPNSRNCHPRWRRR